MSDYFSLFDQIPSDWKLVKLSEITQKIGSGSTPRGGSETYLAERNNFAFIRSQNVYDRHFDIAGLAFISDEQAADLKGVWLKPNDILLNITGDGITFSRACIVPDEILPACVNQHVSIIRVNPDLCIPGYLLSYLTHPSIKQYIESFNSGGSRRAITKGHIESFLIPLPPIAEQRAIAEILGSLDDKIELNRRMNETLEEIARIIFKSWFIDFEPVHAKSRGEQPSGMDAVTAALFPDHFEDSELGLIPAGWRVEPLSNHINARKGLSYKGDGLAEMSTGLPMHNLNSVYEGGGYKYEGMKYYSGEYQERHIAKAGDVIVANTEQGHNLLLIGYPAIIPQKYDEALYSHHLYRVTPHEDSYITPRFIYYLLKTGIFHETIAGYTNGTTVNMLPADGLEKPLFVMPSPEVIQSFDELVLPMLSIMEQNYEQTQQLGETRDVLLPKLISGEVRVGEYKNYIADIA